jgi:hypothetical protein
MVVWAVTAGIGVYLLATGIATARATARPARPPGGGAPAVEGSPLLEFTHPALALLGLTFWIFFVMTGDHVFAWIAFGVVVATVAAGLGWEQASRRRRRRGARSGADTSFPPHLIMLHAAAAACTFALVVIAAVGAAHG